MNTQRRVVPLILSIVLCLSLPSKAQEGQSAAAEALFERFETVFSLTPALLLPSAKPRSGNFVELPFVYLLTGLGTVDEGLARKVVANSRAILLGSKDYRLPDGLGSVRSTFCYIAVLKSGEDLDLQKEFNSPTVAAAAGNPVWAWSATLGEFGENDPRPSSLYAAKLGTSYLLVANDLDELLDLAHRLASLDTNFPVLQGLQEWSSVSKHPFWAYRRYRHPESALEKAAGGLQEISLAAQALIVYVDGMEQKGVLRLLVSETNDPTAKKLNARGMVPKLKSTGPKTWQTTFPLDESGSLPDSAFGILWLLGFGQVI